MTAKTSEALAQALDNIGLHLLAARARNDEFHDFLSPHATPELMLVGLLAHAAQLQRDPIIEKQILGVRARVINGDFDASSEESDAWAESPEGLEAFSQLLGKKP